MNELKSRDRLLRLFRGEPIDRIPVSTRIFPGFTRWFFQDLNIDIVEGAYAIYRRFGMDIIDQRADDTDSKVPTRCGQVLATVIIGNQIIIDIQATQKSETPVNDDDFPVRSRNTSPKPGIECDEANACRL